MRRTLRYTWAWLAVLATLLSFSVSGCGKKETALDTAAPPPANPGAQPEVSPNKRLPPRPPTAGGPGGK